MQTLMHKSTLRLRRHRVDLQKDMLINDLTTCQSTLPPISADDTNTARIEWETSPLRTASAPERSHFQHLTEHSAIAVAIANPHGKLLWTSASPQLRNLANGIHFDAGANWGEYCHSTNALSMALKTKRPCTVFAAEHALPACRELVCYAAPILHPQSQQIVGVLDMSMNWQQHTPLAQTAIAYMARNIAQRLPHYLAKAELEIHALGSAWVLYQGQRLQLSLRQMEILCILALHPAGMSLDTLHQALCGNEGTNPATIKTILTQLRHLLGGNIASNPYRLLPSLWADFIELSTILRQHRTADALKLYHGELLSMSNAPALEIWRHHLEADMEKLLYDCTEAQLLIDHADNLLRTPMIRERLIELLS